MSGFFFEFEAVRTEPRCSAQVKAEFGDEPEIYNEFLEIMKSFKSQQIDTPGVIRRVSTLFEGYGKLIYGFNTFLPEGYKIEVPEHLREQLRGQVNAVPRGQQAAAPPPRPRAPARRPARQAEEPPRQPVEFDNAIAYVTAIKKRFEHQPETYKAFLEVLHTYQREQKGIQEVLRRVAELFKDHADLLREFTYFLPDAAIEPAQRLFLQRAAADAEQRNPGGYRRGGRGTRSTRGGRGGRGSRRTAQASQSSDYSRPYATTAGASRGDRNLDRRILGQPQTRNQGRYRNPVRPAGHMSLPELRDEAKHAQLCAQEDLLAAKKRRFAHFGLTNSASQRQDEAAVLRRLRYALIGDGASDGTRQKQRSSHLTKTLGCLKDALVPYGRSSFGDPRYKVRRPLPVDATYATLSEEDRKEVDALPTAEEEGYFRTEAEEQDDMDKFLRRGKYKHLREGDPPRTLEERLGGTEDIVQRCKDAVAAAEKAFRENPPTPAPRVEPTDVAADAVAAAVAADAKAQLDPDLAPDNSKMEKKEVPMPPLKFPEPVMLSEEESKLVPHLVADVPTTTMERERLYAWRCVLRGLDAVAKGALSSDAFEQLLSDVVDRVVDWGRGHARGSRLVGDVAMLCRRSARIGPSGEWADAAYALARRAAHPGRRVEVDPDDDPLQYVGVARRPRYVLDDSDSNEEEDKEDGPDAVMTTRGVAAQAALTAKPSTRAGGRRTPPPNDDDDDDQSLNSGERALRRAAKVASGRQQTLGDWTSLPLSELDFGDDSPFELRRTPSYRRLPESVPRPVCSHRSELDASVLNDDWVSVAVGSEDGNFSQLQLRRNAHEEQLFKTEDEHFEIVLTQRPFPNVSELQLCENGVSTMSRRRGAVFMIIRESTRLVSEQRRPFHTGHDRRRECGHCHRSRSHRFRARTGQRRLEDGRHRYTRRDYTYGGR